jgi:hypothetical protein
MTETLYKTRTPEVGKSESYELSLKQLPGVVGPRRSYVKEDHGRWVDHSETFIHHITTLNTAEEGVTYEEAETIYTEARANRAKSGFVHSFSPAWPGGYQLIETP